ncbi:MAG: hypothetical protein SOW53_05870, partial [Eubacteriales bacterium]|nr:hypothetical protein [Eubacteriales bacterium]
KTKCATRTRLRTNPSRTPKIHQILAVLGKVKHQNSDFLGESIRRLLNPAFFGGIYLCVLWQLAYEKRMIFSIFFA